MMLELQDLETRDLPAETVRQLIRASTIPVGKVVYGNKNWISYGLTKSVDRALCRLSHDDGAPKKLILNMPSQTGKTASLVNFIARYKCMNPHRAVQYITYSDVRSGRVGNQVKDAFKQIAPFFGIALSKSSQGKKEWEVQGGKGAVISRGIGEGITGYEADLVVFDDPYKGPEEAESKDYREKVRNLWDTVIRLRLAEDAIVVVCQTRWHVSDLTGFLVRQGKRNKQHFFHQLSIPAIADEGDVYDTFGDLVVRSTESPDCRYSHERFLREKQVQTEYNWNSLFQQRPQRAQGSLWGEDYFGAQYFAIPDESDVKFRAIGVDPSLGKSLAQNDYTAIVETTSIGDGNIYVDAMLGRWSPQEIIQMLVRFVFSKRRQPDAIGFEDYQFQQVLAENGAKELREAGITSDVYGMPPEAINPLTGQKIGNPEKIQRITLTLDWLVRAKLFRWTDSPGTLLLIDQMADFPSKAAHDDGPDGLEISVRTLRKFVALHKQRMRRAM